MRPSIDIRGSSVRPSVGPGLFVKNRENRCFSTNKTRKSPKDASLDCEGGRIVGLRVRTHRWPLGEDASLASG